MHRTNRAHILGLLLALTAACSAGTEGGSTSTGGGGGEGGAGAALPEGGGGSGAGFASGGGSAAGGGPPEIAEVFGHSATTLYRLDPDTKAISVVGEFDGCTDVVDIALDEGSNILGTTFDALVRIDKQTAACTVVADGSFPNSLSFVPKGTLLPNEEALVGYIDDVYVRIDPTSGSVTDVGTPWDNGYISSGDIVSVKNGKTFLTVKGGGCSDCLVEVDPKTGALVKNWGALGHSQAFGIAFWAGSVYGFTNGGELFEVTFDQGTLATTLISNPANTSFWGAGSTTSAPPEPIPR